MKLFQKTSVAVALTIIMISAAIGIGQWRAASADPVEETAQSTRLDSSLSTAAYTKWIDDQANVLTDQQEEQICLFNANWVKRYDSLIAVATRTSIDGKIDDYAYDLGVQIELAAADGILVINTSTGECYLAVGPDYPMTDSQVSSYMDQYLYEDAMAGKFGDGVVKLFTGVNEFYVDQYGLGYLSKGSSSYNSGTDTIISVIALVVILVVIASILDSLRYTSYRQRYYGVVNPPYVFRPILFWHGPGYGWYQRRWRRPPPEFTPVMWNRPGRQSCMKRRSRLKMPWPYVRPSMEKPEARTRRCSGARHFWRRPIIGTASCIPMWEQ